jgi:putative YhbY family RNA-binding protein
MNKILSPTERRALKARAHPLKPTVMIGNDGLSASVMQEIDSTLKAHELIKIRIDHDDADEREDMLGIICANTGASAIDHIGKILVVYRERPKQSRSQDINGNGRGNTSRTNASRTQRSGAPRQGGRGDQRQASAQGQARGNSGNSAQDKRSAQPGGGQQRKPKKPGGAVWTKVRPQRQQRRSNKPKAQGE